jgi:hypothetical protein
MGRSEPELRTEEERPVSIAAGAKAIGRAASTVRKWIAAGDVRPAILGKGSGRGNGSLVLISELRRKVGGDAEAGRGDAEQLELLAETLWNVWKRDAGIDRGRTWSQYPLEALPMHKVLGIKDYAAAGFLWAIFERHAIALTGRSPSGEELPKKIRSLADVVNKPRANERF